MRVCGKCGHALGERCGKCGREFACGSMSEPCDQDGCEELVVARKYADDGPIFMGGGSEPQPAAFPVVEP